MTVTLGVGIVVIVGVFGWTGSRSPTDASWLDLEAGECFDFVSEPSGWIGDVQVKPCSEPHHAQALLWESLGDGPFPGDGVLIEEGEAACHRTIRYAIQPSSFQDVSPRFIAPQEHEWEQARNRVLCVVQPVNGPTLVGSVSTLAFQADAAEIETVAMSVAAVNQGPVSVWELRPGTCLTDPGVESWPDVVDAKPCTDPHDIEVYGIGRWPDQEAYPGREALWAAGTWYCLEQFPRYTGVAFAEATVEVGVLTPDESEWADEHRRLACLLTSGTDEPLTRSYRYNAAS